MLTTITPYWGRPAMLRSWLKAIARAHSDNVQHIVFMVGENLCPDLSLAGVRMIRTQLPRTSVRPSIGYYHNMGAELANTEWIMKLDVDALPNERFFHELCDVLSKAGEREWFNAGMFYINKDTSERVLDCAANLLSTDLYSAIVRRMSSTAGPCRYTLPVATNFICRREAYLKLGGCDPRFKGWGWEDYQQIYMLEKYQRGTDPLPGELTLTNVTLRCRDEISRPKASQLYRHSPYLALLHHWHPTRLDLKYKNPKTSSDNRTVLMKYLQSERQTNENNARRPIHTQGQAGSDAG